MVYRLVRTLPGHTEGQSARTDRRRQESLSRGQLEIAFQQSPINGARIEPPELLLQRSRIPHRLRMRVMEGHELPAAPKPSEGGPCPILIVKRHGTLVSVHPEPRLGGVRNLTTCGRSRKLASVFHSCDCEVLRSLRRPQDDTRCLLHDVAMTLRILSPGRSA